MKIINFILDLSLILFSLFNILTEDDHGVGHFTFWGMLLFGIWDIYRASRAGK